jgi:hypothetical protein
MIIIEHKMDVWKVMFPCMMVVGTLGKLHFEVYLNLNDILCRCACLSSEVV